MKKINEIHFYLINNQGWYAKWHLTPISTLVHYLILIIFVIFVGANIISSVKAPEYSLTAQVLPFEDLRFYERMKDKRELEGQEAVKALGLDIARVARHYGNTAGELKYEFETSKTLRINPHALLFYADEIPEQAALGEGSLSNNATSDQIPDSLTFYLHSKPSASAKIFLDFDGAYVANTSWNVNGPINLLPYSEDSDGTTFISSELDSIKRIWRAVAEDYAQFNIDITTEMPKSYDTTRFMQIIITPSWEWYGKVGGVAFLNSFTWADETPAFVFSSLLSNNVKNIAEASAHEAGHTIGLRHQSSYDFSCVKLSDYNWGSGSNPGFAPIMGASYNQGVTTFVDSSSFPLMASSLGCSSEQNDVNIISSLIGFTPDETTASSNSAQFLKRTVTNNIAYVDQPGILSLYDVDLYKFDALSGDIKLTISPIANFPMGDNDFMARLLDSNMNVIAESNPPSVAVAYLEKLGASLGTYYIEISQSGYLDPTIDGGYTVKESSGNYYISGNYSSNDTTSSSGDIVAPTVSVNSPNDGALVSGSVSISATAQDNVKVTKMEILVDSKVVKTSTSGSISYKWNTGKFTKGVHTITTKAYDAAGNIGIVNMTVTK